MSQQEFGVARNSFASAGEIDTFLATLARFESGEISPDEWRAFRLVSGTYGQRQEGDLSMLRVKIPQGILTSAQVQAVAHVSETYSRGFSHVTTRQNVQFHFIPLHQIGAAMGVLDAAGLTTREACGNSVRNVTTSATAGVADDEVFDPVPFAEAFTRHFLRHPLSSTLPRKFKVAFSGGGRDHSFAAINDIGFFARWGASDTPCFRVVCAGGTATMVASGRLLFAELPATDILAVGEALLALFHARGDREHRQKNRMKFLVKSMGWDAFHAEFLTHFEAAKARSLRLPFDPSRPPRAAAPAARTAVPSTQEIDALLGADRVKGPGIVPRHLPIVDRKREATRARFLRTNVAPQRQHGFSIVTVTLPLGDVSSGRWRVLARLAEAYADGELRTTATQNVVLRWVPTEDVDALYTHLDRIGLGRPDPVSVADVGSCPGAESCKLAVTQSRGVAALVNEELENDLALLDRAKGLEVRVSGCPNGCGLHHVAGIGLQGGLRKVEGRPVPQYFLTIGGDASGEVARFGRLAAKVPARRVPSAIRKLVALYERERESEQETMTTFLGRVDIAVVKKELADLEKLDKSNAQPEDFIDLGETAAFAPITSEGECAV